MSDRPAEQDGSCGSSRYESWDDTAEVVGSARKYLDSDAIRASFERYVNARRDAYPVIEYYAANGDWRETDTDALPAGTVVDVLDRVPNRDPNSCYYNAQTAIEPGLTYCEGYAVNRELVAVVPHAWLERDGVVIDVTPTVTQSECEYFGVAFDHDVVADAMADRGTADPVTEYVIGTR